MRWFSWVTVAVVGLVLWPIAGVAREKLLSREEVEALWEGLLREERYVALEFVEGSPQPRVVQPTHRKWIWVQDLRKAYLWNVGGLSGGGGWQVRGELEAEIPLDAALLQVFSKRVIHWRPGFALLDAGYDPRKYPQWEFRLLLRNPRQRQEIRPLKSISVAPGEVLPTSNPDGTSVKELLGQRVPRAELEYDARRSVAIVRILGLHTPITVEVPISSAPFSTCR